MADSTSSTLTPACVVKLNGTKFSAEQQADLKEIVVTEQVDLPSSFTITMSDSLRKWTDNEGFSEGAKITIELGYKDDYKEVITAEITGLSPLFQKNADDLVQIQGHSQLHRLNRGKKTRTFSNKSYSEVIQQMASDNGMQHDIDDLGSQKYLIMQQNQTDYEYIMNIARLYNCKVWAKEGKLHVKQFNQADESDVIFEWGKTLVDFKPRINSVGLYDEVEVRGWDATGSQSVVGSAGMDDVGLKIGGDKLGGKIASDSFGGSKMVIVDDNVLDQNTAESIAKEVLTGNSLNFIVGTGKAQGNYNVKAGKVIELKELGTRFSGKYFVKSLKHRFTATEGYQTHFDVVRNAL